MIFEYLPTQSAQDIENISFACSVLPITKILIPSNPINRIYPDSIAVAAFLRERVQPYSHLRHIQFIPTIKSSIYTAQSLQSAFYSLQYFHINHVAIITGDAKNSASLDTHYALMILKDMQKTSSFLQQLQVFCAMESHISARNSHVFCQKLGYGVSHFITQPFYRVKAQAQNHKMRSKNTYPAQFLPQPQPSNIEDFLYFYQNLIKIIRYNKLCSHIPEKVQFYFGFLPLTQTQQIESIHAKKIGIVIPNEYKKRIQSDALTTNLALFDAIRDYNISISYLQFRDIESLLHVL